MLLVVTQDRELADRLARTFESGGHGVELQCTAPAGLGRLCTTPAPDLVVVDLTLPLDAGFKILRTLHQDGNDVPVIALGVRDNEAERIQAFRFGAYQYVGRDVGMLELMVRVDALLERSRARRTRGKATTARARPAYRFGDIEVNAATREVRRGGQPVGLAPMELELLLALIRRQGTTAARMELLREVWGYESDVVSRTLDTHVANLRGKLERDPATPRHILTVRKAGYRLQP